MALLKLDVVNVRNIESATLSPGEGLNLLFGENGSGKTSLLESIYLLSRGKSFRSAQPHRIIRFEQTYLTVSGRIGHGGPHTPLGVRLGRNEKEVRIGGKSCESSSQLIKLFPAILILPTSISLLDGSPKFRRQMLDWGVFHVEHEHLELLRRFSRALEQRNMALRFESAHNLEVWSGELARCGTIVASARSGYLDRIHPHFKSMVSTLLGPVDAELIARPGWKSGCSYAEALESSIATDRRQGYTESGPQKGDFTVLVEGRSAKDYLSRGQLKLLTYALLLAQAIQLEEDHPGQACLLVDDIASELDVRNQGRLLELLNLTGIQSFVTFSTKDRIPDTVGGAARMFHVEHGRIIDRE